MANDVKASLENLDKSCQPSESIIFKCQKITGVDLVCALCKGQAAILLDTLINEFRYCCSSLCLSLGKDNERSYYAVQEIIVLHPS